MNAIVPPIKATDLTVFNRYHAIIDDVPAFERTLRKAIPRFVWTNTLRTTPENLYEILTRAGFTPRPLAWYPSAFRIEGAGTGLGRHWSYFAGFFQIQEASSMVPVCILDPQPGESVLDLCAAPGNKTAQIGVALQNRGTVVANEPVKGRLGALRATLERLGLANVSITAYNGLAFPKKAGRFDIVLVDAPCSCEGISRKNPGVLKRNAIPTKRYDLKQKALLQQAVRRCRTGGRILYSTCTYAPEENEAVVDAVVKAFRGQIEIMPAELPGLRTSPGLTRWAGATFSKALRRTLRIWPHFNDSGGFYVALLKKCGTAPSDPQLNARRHTAQHSHATVKGRLDAHDRRQLMQMLASRFGLEEKAFEAIHMVQTNRRDVSVVAQDHLSPQIRLYSSGLPLMHFRTRFPKLTTAGAVAYGPKAQRNCVVMHASQMTAYMARRPVVLTPDQIAACEGSGFVLMRYQDAVLGVGFYREQEGAVASLFPKGWAMRAT